MKSDSSSKTLSNARDRTGRTGHRSQNWAGQGRAKQE